MPSNGDSGVHPEGIVGRGGSASNNTTDDGGGRGGHSRGCGWGQHRGHGGQQGCRQDGQ